MPPSVYIARRTNLGDGLTSLIIRSRKRARLSAKRHEHLVFWDPAGKILTCSCPGYNYRRTCSATTFVLRRLA